MTPAALATARAAYHERAESVRVRLVRSADALRDAVEEWDEITAPQRAVLVVEDDMGLARMTALTLESELGASAMIAYSYDQAVRLVARMPWCVIVLDLDLSDPEGRTGVALLRSIPRTTPVVISTGRLAGPDLARLAARARCGAHVKGDPTPLMEIVRATIAAHGDTT